jgi:hypothetical protein
VTRPAALALALLTIAASIETAAPRTQACATVAGVRVTTEPVAGEDAARELLLVPGTVARPGVASPTRAPWVNTNGARYRRQPAGKFRYELPEGKGALAAAEALAYSGDAVLQIVAADMPAVCGMLAFGTQTPAVRLPDVADIGVVDNGSPSLAEVLNLFVRRNLLFEIVPAPQKKFAVNVTIGSPEYPAAEAADPSGLALKVRRQLTDDRRGLRVFGSEVVIVRFTADAARARLHLLNYGNRESAGLRVRVRGAYRSGEAFVAGQGRSTLRDQIAAGDATEFSLPTLTTYAIVDLR